VSFPRKAQIALFCAFAAHLYFGLSFIRSAAPTYDESVHLASGFSYWKTGRLRMNIMDHPPLAEMLAAAPAALMGPSLLSGHPDRLAMRLYHYSDAFVFKNVVDAEKMINGGRFLLFLLLSGLLMWALVDWGARLGGASGAVAAAWAAALCPIIVSNFSIVATDATSAVFFFLTFWLLSFQERSKKKMAAAGACVGLALASKFNMIVLPGMAGAMLFLDAYLGRREDKNAPAFPFEAAGMAVACALAALALSYGVFQFDMYFKGLIATLKRLDQGRSAFFHGAHSVTGFLLYFPAALALKTPIPVLSFSAERIWRWARGGRREHLWVLLPMLGYFAVAMTSKVQIGVRHILPMMPFFALCAGCGAAALYDAGGWRRKLALAGAVWALVSVGKTSPYQLAYFNEAAGGPDGGYRWLVDSNLDWGQDLKSLAQETAARGNPPIYLSYFGSADPDYYGIKYLPLAMCCNVTRRGSGVDPAASGRVLLAVSATNLQAVYFRHKSLFSWLKERRPAAKPGHSIFLYDLTDDRDGRAKLADLVKATTGDPSLVKSLLLQ